MTTIANVADQATVAFSGEGSSQKQTALAGRMSFKDTARFAIWRWYERVRIMRSFRHMSDRMLRDIGFEPEGDMSAQINACLYDRWVERQEEIRVTRELQAYTDAELDDVGIKRTDIPAVARGARALEIKAANPQTTVVRPAPAVNDRRHQIAAA